MASFSDTVRAVGSYTLSKIIPLQASYLGRSNASWARAQLARLRKLGTPEDRTWFSVGADVFGEWPEDKLGVPDESSATFKAVSAALQLYALHQQSQDRPMALVFDKSESIRRGGFGQACRRIEFDLDKAGGVRRRLSQVETAGDIEHALVFLRALVSQLRQGHIPLDYYMFAGDLYRIQFAAGRGSVFNRWSREYYMAREDETDPGASE